MEDNLEACLVKEFDDEVILIKSLGSSDDINSSLYGFKENKSEIIPFARESGCPQIDVYLRTFAYEASKLFNSYNFESLSAEEVKKTAKLALKKYISQFDSNQETLVLKLARLQKYLKEKDSFYDKSNFERELNKVIPVSKSVNYSLPFNSDLN